MTKKRSKRSSPSGSAVSKPAVSTPLKTSSLQTAKTDAPPQSPYNYEKYKSLKQVAQDAINDKKTFTIYYPFGTSIHRPLRKALIKRNWSEKLYPNQLKVLQSKSQHTLLHNAVNGNQSEVAALSKLLHGVPIHFVWQPKYFRVDQPIDGLPFRNRLHRCNNYDFTRKECLVGCTKEHHWMHVYGRCELNCPRSYRMFIPDEVADFVDDYRFTGCISLLSRVANAIADPSSLFAAGGSVNTKCIDFAIKRINESLSRRQHKDIDTALGNEMLDALQWSDFFKDFNAIVRLRGRFREVKVNSQREWCENCSRLMRTVRMNWSLSPGDGLNNIWIMKPGGKNCGIGIVVVHDCREIVKIAERGVHQRYIVQKYLGKENVPHFYYILFVGFSERPLLIHNTKFDIRQYFLIVVRSQCVQLWMYRTCYLKFSSHEFSLDSTDESVHLTNHCVQRKYANQKNRSALLPANNMWTLQQFKAHLVNIGEPDAWSLKIYPGIKRNAIAAMIASHNELEAHPNSFELYGGDFIINEMFESILLEVNASPDMSVSHWVFHVFKKGRVNSIKNILFIRRQHRLREKFALNVSKMLLRVSSQGNIKKTCTNIKSISSILNISSLL